MPLDRRLLRLQQLVLETVATSVQKDLDDPRVQMVTVTRVKLARDLTSCVVFWSNLEEGGPRRTAERGLHDALPYLQASVAGVLGTRQTPRLSLQFDEGLERSARLEGLFAQLAKDRGDPPPAEPTAGSDAEDDEDEDADDDDEVTAEDEAEADDAADDSKGPGEGEGEGEATN